VLAAACVCASCHVVAFAPPREVEIITLESITMYDAWLADREDDDEEPEDQTTYFFVPPPDPPEDLEPFDPDEP